VEVIQSLREEYQFVLRAHYSGNKSAEEDRKNLKVYLLNLWRESLKQAKPP
jgi:hypothetical protein